MAFDVNGVAGNAYNPLTALNEQLTDPVTAQLQADAAAAEKNGEARKDGFIEKPYKPSTEEINALRSDMKTNIGAFRAMVQSLFQKQGGYKMDSAETLQKITSESLKETSFDESQWGVEAVATRILDFAKALAGDDPSKIDLLSDAIEKGFKAAEDLWGGRLPEISYETRNRVREGIQEWRDSYNKPAETEAAASEGE